MPTRGFDSHPSADAAIEGFEPIRPLGAEIGRPLAAIDAVDPIDGRSYRQALCLVRLFRRPVGILRFDIPSGGMDAAEVARRIWAALGEAIRGRLREEGLPEIETLTADGVPAGAIPRSEAWRRKVLANPPLASVVVATRDRAVSLDTTLRSLLRQDYPSFEIIVVDNAPATGDTEELMRRSYGGEQRIRYLRENRPGLATAHNAGTSASAGSIIAFTDDDVVADPGWLTSIAVGFAREESVGCVTGLILPAELETRAQELAEQFGGFGKGFEPRLFDLGSNRPDDPLYPYAAGVFGSGANMSFKAETLDRIGGFDATLGAGSKGVGGDDLAAFFDVVAGGSALLYEPAAIVWHRHRRDYEGLLRQAYGYGTGLTAYLARTVARRPLRVFSLVSRVPRGVAHILAPGSRKNAGRPADFPRELAQAERRGMLRGPFAYIASRLAASAEQRRAAAARKPGDGTTRRS